MKVTLSLSCGGTVSFNYTPAPGESMQDVMMDLALAQGNANAIYCPPPPPLNEA